MGGFTILWNYSAYNTQSGGEAQVVAFDPKTSVISNANGWVKFNNVKRTINKVGINPNAVLPYKIPIYIVYRLSSASATTGTMYMVWYSGTESKWKYAITPTPTAIEGDWTWTLDTDIILGKFVEPSGEAFFTDCEIFNPPLTSKHVTTNTVTAVSAQDLATTANNTANAAAPKSSAVSRTQRIWYRTNTSTNLTGPTTWVTENTDIYSTWTTKCPPLAGSIDTSGSNKYPYLYTCTQTQTVAQQAAGNVCTASAVLLDDSTTIIDGGKIITGSVTANKIDATDINASGMLTVGALSQATQDDILNENVIIGGRNLTLNGNAYYQYGIRGTNVYFSCSNPLNEPNIRRLNTTEYGKSLLSDTNNEFFTVSFDYTITDLDTECSIYVGLQYGDASYNSTYPYISKDKTDILPVGNSSGHHSFTFTPRSEHRAFGGAWLFNLTGSTSNNRNAKLTIHNFKFELGTKETGFSLAPENIDAMNNPNILPFFSIDPNDSNYWYTFDQKNTSSTNTEGYEACYVEPDGWAHIIEDTRAESGNANKTGYQNFWLKPNAIVPFIKPNTVYTLLIEVKELVGSNIGYIFATNGSTHGLLNAFTNDYEHRIYQNGTYYSTLTSKTAEELAQLTRGNRGYIFLEAERCSECRIRISLYEGYYAGSYKPYVGKLLYPTNTDLATTNLTLSGAVIDTQTIYIQAVSGTNTMAKKNDAWVSITTESTVSDTTGLTPVWTTKRPTYRSNYPVIFVAQQTKLIDGTIVCSTPVKDDTLTVIDGGHITTGTIDASTVTVTNINATNITSGKLSANVIEGGSLSIGKLDTSTQNIINKATAYQGKCSTAATTAIKVVTCDNFVLINGAIITVYFTTSSNVNGKIQLNVNDTGAVDIWVGSGATSSTNRLLWLAYTSITFVYDGTIYRVADNPPALYGDTCSTGESTGTKNITCPYAVIFKGATITIPMTYANNSSSGALQIGNGTYNLMVIPVYHGTGTTVPTKDNGKSWLAGSTVIFTYDGCYWRTGNQTYIDGGNIVSHSITADQINTASLSIGYSQLTDTPSIPSKVSDLTNDSNFQTGTQVSNAIDDISVGGRNLLFNTSDKWMGPYLSNVNTNNYTMYPYYTDDTSWVVQGRYLTLTFEIEVNMVAGTGGTPHMYPQMQFVRSDDTSSWATRTNTSFNTLLTDFTGQIGSGEFVAGNNIYRYSYTGIINETAANIEGAKGIRFGVRADYVGTNTYIKFRNVKLELGNKATAWSPAPEDLSRPPAKNLHPFYTRGRFDIYDSVYNPKGAIHYLTAQSDLDRIITYLDDGWLHCHFDNSSGTAEYTNNSIRPQALSNGPSGEYLSSVKGYTILVEIRNNNTTLPSSGNADMYTQQTVDTQFWGNGTNYGCTAEGAPNNTGTINFKVIGESYKYYMHRTQNVGTTTTYFTDPNNPVYTELFRYNLRIGPGGILDFDVRFSIYEGYYEGEYLPYVEDTLYLTDTQTRLAKTEASNLIMLDNPPLIYTVNTNSVQRVNWWVMQRTSSTAISIEKTSNGVKITRSGTTTSYATVPLKPSNKLLNGDVVTLSFDYKTNTTRFGQMVFITSNNSQNQTQVSGNNIKSLEISESSWKHYEFTWTVINNSIYSDLVQLAFYGWANQVNDWLEIKDGTLKLEKGNTLTRINEAEKRTNVDISIVSINYDSGTATLKATLYIDGVATTTGVAYQWYKDGQIITGQTLQQLSVTSSMGINHIYSCNVGY